MKYFHCPTSYRSAVYGCGFGPVNATVAFLDLGQRCPRCGKALRPFQKPKLQPAFGRCSVTGVTGEHYCKAPATVRGTDSNLYCRRHQYLAVA